MTSLNVRETLDKGTTLYHFREKLIRKHFLRKKRIHSEDTQNSKSPVVTILPLLQCTGRLWNLIESLISNFPCQYYSVSVFVNCDISQNEKIGLSLWRNLNSICIEMSILSKKPHFNVHKYIPSCMHVHWPINTKGSTSTFKCIQRWTMLY